MSSTTLMTFLLNTPGSTSAVNLLGSWDNFSKPYPMQRDWRVGSGCWRGCHLFTDIICDGEFVDRINKRDGGLKMGGRYWYYYELDGETEYFDPAEPTTTACPFLPGQEVNVLDVPTHTVVARDSRSGSSSSLGYEFSLDPNHKYVTPCPVQSNPSSQGSDFQGVVQHAHAMPSSRHDGFKDNASYDGGPVKPTFLRQLFKTKSVPSLRSRSIRAKLHRLRAIGSSAQDLPDGPVECCAPSTSYSLINFDACIDAGAVSPRAEPRLGGVTGPSMLRLSTDSEAECPLFIDEPFPQCQSSCSGLDLPVCSRASYARSPQLHHTVSSSVGDVGPDASADVLNERWSLEDDGVLLKRVPGNADLSMQSWLFATDTEAELGLPVSLDPSDKKFGVGLAHEMCRDHTRERSPDSRVPSSAGDDPGPFPLYQTSTWVSSSNRTSGMFSSGLSSTTTYTGYTSPPHLAQPETPLASEFGEYYLEASQGDASYEPSHRTLADEDETSYLPEYAGSGRFPGYRLSQQDHGSALTLRLSPYQTPCTEAEGFERKSSNSLVRSWNDGAHAHKTALEELIDDLGYLGGAII